MPLRARWNAPRRAAVRPQGTGLLPARTTLLDVEGDGLVVTAIKPLDGRPSGHARERPSGRADEGAGVIVRLYNTLDGPTTGRLRLAEPWRRAEVVDMKEEALGPADVADGWVRLELRPNEIVTLRFDATS